MSAPTQLHSHAGAVTPERTPNVEIIETPDLGDRSYVVHLDGAAVVIDPQRDIDRVYAVLAQHGLRVTHVLETRIHNDYVTGGYQLAAGLGARYVVPAGYDLRYDAMQVGDGDCFTAGPMAWRAMHTPGHTPQHLSYVVAIDGIDAAAFTGGSLLYGSVGRPDLTGPHMTEELAHAQWRSVRRLTTEVAGHAALFPTHGFGSFCSATATTGRASTIAEQAIWNPASLLPEAEFVARVQCPSPGATNRARCSRGCIGVSGRSPVRADDAAGGRVRLSEAPAQTPAHIAPAAGVVGPRCCTR